MTRTDKPNYRALAVLSLFAMFALPACYAQEEEEAERVRNFLEVEHALSMELVTPHIAWAKPYAAGKTQVVFFSPWYQGGTEAREIIELMQRFDLSAQAVYLQRGGGLIGDNHADWYGGDVRAGSKRVARLLDQLTGVAFVNEVKLAQLGPALLEKLHQKVLLGLGLVLIGDNPSVPFADAWPLAGTPPVAAPAARFYQLGKGRIALLPSRQKLQYRLGWEAQFDYQMQFQGRVLLWAAARAPKAVLSLDAPVEPLQRASLPARAVTLKWSGMSPATSIKLSLRTGDGIPRPLPAVKAAAAGSTRLQLPRLREGDYHLDAIARDARGVENWATAEFRVVADRRLSAVKLDRDWAEIGEKIAGTVQSEGSLVTGDRVLVRLLDRRGRILSQSEAPAAASVPFSFSIEPWMPMFLRVEAVIENGDGEVSWSYALARVTKRHRGQFNFIMWNSPSGDLAPYASQALERYGVTAVLQGGQPPLSMSEHELSSVPYAASFRSSSHTLTAMLDPATGSLKPHCIWDERKMAETVRATVQNSQLAREHGTFVYSLGDENAVRGSCLSPYCLHAYRRYLKQIYRDVAALNREWETTYASFDDVRLLSDGDLPSASAPTWFQEYFSERRTLLGTDSEGAKGDALKRQIALGDINDEMRALQQGNFARWYDRQAFQNYSYVEWCKQIQKGFAAIDPQALTGFEGTDSFAIRKHTTRSRQGGDIDLFVREMGYFGPYGGPANEVLRSIAPAGFPRGNWTGYDPDVKKLMHDYWGQVTDGMNMVQWWRVDNLDGYHGYITPSFAPFPEVSELLKDTQIVRDGLGTLLMNYQGYDDGIAMLYSMPSTYISHFDGNESYGNYDRDHGVWHKMLHNAGVQFRYVTDRMLRQGEADLSKYKVLLLPLAYSISPEEAEAIRNFVRNGGTVIADVRPATYDGHNKPLKAGLLDDLFGIRRLDKRDARGIDRLNIDGQLNGVKVRMKWGNWQGHDVFPQMKVDPSVSLSTAKSLGAAYLVHYWAGLSTPVGIVNQFGKGKAVLLNFSLFEAPAGGLLSDLLASAGVKPALRITRPDGSPVKGVEVTRWNNGGIDLVALFGDVDGEFKVNLPEARVVSDLKARRELGLKTEFTVTLRANRAEFFSLQSKADAKPWLELPASPVPRGATATARLRIPSAQGLHAVMVRAFLPNGEPAEWLSQTLLAGDKEVTLALPFAFNDPAGAWRIRATDLLGNHVTEARLTVR